MLRFKSATAPYLPNRGTVARVQNHPATQTAGTVLGATANAAGTLASATVVPATIAALSYAQRAVDPDGRFDADVDHFVDIARQGAKRVVSGIAAMKTALSVDINDPAVSGHVEEPCDIKMVELHDDDDLLAFPERQPDVLGTYANRESIPCAKSDDGLEDVSLYTTTEVQKNKEGRITVPDGFGEDGYEMVDEEDGIDERTEHYYNERLAESTISSRRDSSGTNLQFPVENLTLAEVELRAEMDRLLLTTQWQSHEAIGAERDSEMEMQRESVKYAIATNAGGIPVVNTTIHDADAVEETTAASAPIDIPGFGKELDAGDSQKDISFHPTPVRSAPAPVPVKIASGMDTISDDEEEDVSAVAEQIAKQMSASFVCNEAKFKLAADNKAAAARKLQATVEDEGDEEYLSEEALGELLWDKFVAAQERAEN